MAFFQAQVGVSVLSTFPYLCEQVVDVDLSLNTREQHSQSCPQINPLTGDVPQTEELESCWAEKTILNEQLQNFSLSHPRDNRK